jgi:hypothetical protein
MKQDWDARAQETTSLYIDNRARNEESSGSWRGGRRMILGDIRQYLTPDAAVEIGCGMAVRTMARRFVKSGARCLAPQMLADKSGWQVSKMRTLSSLTVMIWLAFECALRSLLLTSPFAI